MSIYSITPILPTIGDRDRLGKIPESSLIFSTGNKKLIE